MDMAGPGICSHRTLQKGFCRLWKIRDVCPVACDVNECRVKSRRI